MSNWNAFCGEKSGMNGTSGWYAKRRWQSKQVPKDPYIFSAASSSFLENLCRAPSMPALRPTHSSQNRWSSASPDSTQSDFRDWSSAWAEATSCSRSTFAACASADCSCPLARVCLGPERSARSASNSRKSTSSSGFPGTNSAPRPTNTARTSCSGKRTASARSKCRRWQTRSRLRCARSRS